MKRFREEPFIMEERIEMMIRKAVPQDLDALIALIVRRMAWMDEQGIEQWNTGDYLGIYPPAYFLWRITSGELFVAWDGQLCGMEIPLWKSSSWYAIRMEASIFYPGIKGAVPLLRTSPPAGRTACRLPGSVFACQAISAAGGRSMK